MPSRLVTGVGALVVAGLLFVWRGWTVTLVPVTAADSAAQQEESWERRVEVEMKPDAMLPKLWDSAWLFNQTDADGRRLQADLWTLQHPTNCATTKILLYEYWNYGFGAELHAMSVALSLAFATRRTLVLPATGWHTFGGADPCQGSQFFCFFEPTSSCNVDSINGETPLEWKLDTYTSDARVMKFTGHSYFSGSVNKYAESPGEGYTSRELVWWRAQLLAFLLRPNAHIRGVVTAEWRRLNLNKLDSFMFMHVRHGDKSMEAKLYALDDYIAVLRLWYADAVSYCDTKEGREAPASLCPPPRQVFLSTEDPGVVNAAYANHSEWRWIVTDNKRDNIDTWQPGYHGIQNYNATEQAYIALLNLYISVGAHHLIGTMSSNWTRLIYELMLVLRGGKLPDHSFFVYSLDVPWRAYP